MTILDITRSLTPDIAVYPENPRYEREQVHDVPEASSAISRITMGTHLGTHVDAPRHVDRDGAGIDLVPLERLVGTGHVVDCSDVTDVITRETLEAKGAPENVIVLLKTRNSEDNPRTFNERFVALDDSAAELLRARGVQAVGVDGPSIKKFHVRDRTHQIFLHAGIPIIEGLALKDVTPGAYTCVCLPLSLAGADGAPARVILLKD